MEQYLGLLQEVLTLGHKKADRTGTGTISHFGTRMRFDLQDGFPMVTTKKLHLRSIIHELLWFLNGDTNVKYLNDNGVTIWDAWAVTKEEAERGENINISWVRAKSPIVVPPDFDGWSWTEVLDWFASAHLDVNEFMYRKVGDLGPVYGKQWRSWYTFPGVENIDQISQAIDQLRNDPDSRRIIVSAWNVGELDQMALAPCHSFFQFYTRELYIDERLYWLETNNPEQFNSPCFTNDAVTDDALMHAEMDKYDIPRRALSCQLYQRSADCFLGVPFNVASYALLIHMVAQQVNMTVGDFVWTGGDTHIYSNHMEQVKEQLTRNPLPLPKLVIKRKPDSIFDYKFEDFELADYQSHAPIKAPVAV